MDVEGRLPVYFGATRELYRKLTEEARRRRGTRSSVAAEAVRAYLADPFPVRTYRLVRGRKFRRIATFLTSQEYARLHELSERFSVPEAEVSVSTIIRAAIRRHLGLPEESDDEVSPPTEVMTGPPAPQGDGGEGGP